jgi:hypothetical protein
MKKLKKSDIAVLLMVYQLKKDSLEEISFQQCLSVLKEYPIVVVKPESLDLMSWDFKGINVSFENFNDQHFANIGAYSRLLLSLEFYKRFTRYQYMLIYQLDAFVFSDKLIDWCEKGFDYVGAPWFSGFSSKENEGEFMGVGNGGFSIRRIAAHLKVLKSFSFITTIKENWNNRFVLNSPPSNLLKHTAGFLLDYSLRNNSYWLFNNFKGNEDRFWGLYAARNFDWFYVPSCKEAAAFSFEMQPQRLYELNNRELPFGCHAWWKYDLVFWKPHIEKYGYQI